MTSQSLLVWTPLSAKWNKTIRGQIKFLEQWKRTPVNLQKLWTFSKCTRGMLKKNNLQEKGISSKFNHKEKTPMTENTEDSPQPFIKLKNNKLNFTKKSLKKPSPILKQHSVCSSQPVTKRQQCREVLEPCFMLRSRSIKHQQQQSWCDARACMASSTTWPCVQQIVKHVPSQY